MDQRGICMPGIQGYRGQEWVNGAGGLNGGRRNYGSAKALGGRAQNEV
ncbi:MAG: hypothetical protein AAF544_11770 [Bacteroidota bacterium]